MHVWRSLPNWIYQRRRRLLVSFAGLAVALLGAGCSSFDRAWRNAGQNPPATNAITGRWDGVWRSEVNGHTDRLRCLVTWQTNDTYSARFHAKYKKGLFRFSFGYAVPLQVERQGNSFRFQGEADLGWLAGGVYRYEGAATVTNFFSTYRSQYDHGVFQMARPHPK
jgi:hypothetical protein